MAGSTGDELEREGQQLFAEIGCLCVRPDKQVRLQDLDPSGSHTPGEHTEFDFLIPELDACLVGEITGRNSPDDVRGKYKKFRQAYDLLARQTPTEELWTTIGVPHDALRAFRNIDRFVGFYINTALESLDVDLSPVTNVLCFHRQEWHRLRTYASALGTYARPIILSALNVLDVVPKEYISVTKTNGLMVSRHRKIGSREVGLADIYTFEISPYELLAVSTVYRRDLLPSLSSEDYQRYQRPLDIAKINSIREHVLVDPDFMFPSSILIVLDEESEYDHKKTRLMIPKRSGAATVIDGQHRLFSYASSRVRKVVGEGVIMVTAIKFIQATEDEVNLYSARTFVEINTNQTQVAKAHLEAIAYEVLGEEDARALAAQLLLRVNRSPGKQRGIFATSDTALGVVPTGTVVTEMKRIVNLNTIRRLQGDVTGPDSVLKRGYEVLFGVGIHELNDASSLINRASAAMCRFFGIVAGLFPADWPKRTGQARTGSAFELAKIFAALVKLFYAFLREGLDWDEIRAEVSRMRDNIAALENQPGPNGMLLYQANVALPDARLRVSEDFEFLQRNRTEPTSVLEIRPSEAALE